MNFIQSNTQVGVVPLLADTNLLATIVAGTDVRGQLVKLTAGGKVETPSAAADITLFSIDDVVNINAAKTAATVMARPLSPHENHRLLVNATTGGTGSTGARLVHDTSAYGSVTVSAGASKFVVGYAEEDFVAGQYVLVRPCPHAE